MQLIEQEIKTYLIEDKNIRLTIQNTQDDVTEIKEDLRRIEDKIDDLK